MRQDNPIKSETEIVMNMSASIQATKVTFPNKLLTLAGNLFAPPNLEKGKKYPALVVLHPFGGVK